MARSTKELYKSNHRTTTMTSQLHKYLVMYDQPVGLVYRPDGGHWSDRCIYQDEFYNADKEYNHRTILNNELVIEFDDEDKDLNKACAERVCLRLTRLGLGYAHWWSGNKSDHVHTLVDFGKSNNQLAKRILMKQLCKDLPIKPDYQLCSQEHLIRAEFGRNEKSSLHKTLIYQTSDYFITKKLPEDFWNMYIVQQKKVLLKQIQYNGKSLKEHEGIQYLLRTHDFKTHGDGHTRALFLLIHILRKDWKDDPEGFIAFMQSWYKYSGGYKLTKEQIARNVKTAYKKEYNFTIKGVENWLDDIGIVYRKEKNHEK